MNAVEMKNISKRFGSVLANDGVDLKIKKGEIHCLLGENGAGKTTLMKVLFGQYSRDAGSIFINGEKTEVFGPRMAIDLGLGMIHQHFMLVDRLTVTENIIAGAEPKRGLFIDREGARERIRELSERYGLDVDPGARIEEISVGEQQRVEILKSLYREADILILDEPTAVLTPQETKMLFKVMRELKSAGKTLIFITHKLGETMAISDRVTVLRDGRNAGTVNTAETDPNSLARMMVGRDVVLRVDRRQRESGERIFSVEKLSLYNAESNLYLNNINLVVDAGEILGIAGVEGNGQLELEEALAGLRPRESGRVRLKDRDISELSIRGRRKAGLAYIPSDRRKRGLIGDFSVARNLILGSQWNQPFTRRKVFAQAEIQKFAREAVERFDIRCPSVEVPVSGLSGGNQQKLILARELMREPDFILASQPTRGVDVGAIEFIHNLLLELRDEGRGILLISAELDELRSLSDRIAVIYEGELVARGRTEEFSEEELGLLMAGKTAGGVEDV